MLVPNDVGHVPRFARWKFCATQANCSFVKGAYLGKSSSGVSCRRARLLLRCFLHCSFRQESHVKKSASIRGTGSLRSGRLLVARPKYADLIRSKTSKTYISTGTHTQCRWLTVKKGNVQNFCAYHEYLFACGLSFHCRWHEQHSDNQIRACSFCKAFGAQGSSYTLRRAKCPTTFSTFRSTTGLIGQFKSISKGMGRLIADVSKGWAGLWLGGSFDIHIVKSESCRGKTCASTTLGASSSHIPRSMSRNLARGRRRDGTIARKKAPWYMIMNSSIARPLQYSVSFVSPLLQRWQQRDACRVPGAVDRRHLIPGTRRIVSLTFALSWRCAGQLVRTGFASIL